jgi:hypothetical protein
MSKTIVSVLDPALDLSKMDLRAYADGGARPESMIREVPGRFALRFRVRDLSVEESLACDSQPSVIYKLRLALCYALESVDCGGGNIILPTGERKEGADRKRFWQDQEYALLVARFGKTVVNEIAAVISEMDERLGEAFRDNDAERYTLLPLSREGLARRERQHAARPQTPSSTA